MKTKLLLFISVFSYFFASAASFTVDGIKYTVTTGTNVEVAANPSYAGTLTVPNTVTDNGTIYTVVSIGDYAFYGCSGLTSVTFLAGSSISSIGFSAFRGSGLTSIAIPENVKTIGNSAFYNTNVTSLTFSGNPTIQSIGEEAFEGLTGLTSITIPDSMISIAKGAFNGCTSLNSVSFLANSSISSFGDNAFSGCSALTSVALPASLQTLGNSAFKNCTNLATVTFAANSSLTSIGFSAFQNCSTLTSIKIPDQVTSIDYSAFQNCTSLTSVTIPQSITSLGTSAFSGLTALTSLICEKVTPLTIDPSIFYNSNNANCKLYVPAGSETSYSIAYGWTGFESYNAISTLSVNDLQNSKKSFSFYPNPAKQFITIKNNSSENFKYNIVDFSGRIIKSGNSKFNENINLESVKSGNYILQIQTENGEKLNEKIIKK